jgi:hypothetical protein
MKFVYLLESIAEPEQTYVGLTDNVDIGSMLTTPDNLRIPPNSSLGAWSRISPSAMRKRRLPSRNI